MPIRVTYENLILERGMVVPSPLTIELTNAIAQFTFQPANVLVILLDNTYAPIAGWLCMKAYPVKWSVSNLDARENSVVIETLELAYQRMLVIRV